MFYNLLIINALYLGNLSNISYVPTSSDQRTLEGIYSLSETTIKLNSVQPAYNFKLGISLNYSYSLNNRWELTYSAGGAFNEKKNILKTNDFGLNYNFLLNRKGRPVNMRFSLLYSFNQFTDNFYTQSTETFFIDNKKFDASNLVVGIGKKTHGIKPELHIYKRFKGLWSWHFSASYLNPLISEDIFYVKEYSGFGLTRKDATINLNNDNIELSINDVKTTTSNLKVGNWFFNFGLTIGI